MGLQHLRAISARPEARVVGIADPAFDPDALGGLLTPDVQVFGTLSR